MHPALLLALSMTVPVACLALLLWLSWLEDTLGESVRKAERRRAPEAVRAIPVPRPAPVAPAPVAPAPVVSEQAERQPVVAEEPTPAPVVAADIVTLVEPAVSPATP